MSGVVLSLLVLVIGSCSIAIPECFDIEDCIALSAPNRNSEISPTSENDVRTKHMKATLKPTPQLISTINASRNLFRFIAIPESIVPLLCLGDATKYYYYVFTTYYFYGESYSIACDE